MTTPEPRVRVEPHGGGLWRWSCPNCTMGLGYDSALEASQSAHRHAATCPALRLARLLRELEALRDNWRAVGNAGLDVMPYSQRTLARQWIYRAADLTALIDRATDGETG